MKNLRLLFFAVFLGCFLPVLSYAQGVFIPARTVFGTVNGITRPIAGATVTVCGPNSPGAPCSPALAGATFKDSALTVPLANPFTTDSNGNYPQVAIAGGNYTVTESAPGFAGFSYQVTVSCAPGGACTVTSFAATSFNSICQVTATQSLAACIAAVGSSGTIEVTPSAGTTTVSSNATVPAGITLRVDQGAVISIANAVTLTINGPFQAPNATVFAYVGTGIVAFGDGQGMVNANWFPGVDFGAQLNNACLAVPGGNHGGSIFIPEGAYSYSTPVVCNSTSRPVAIKGAGTNNTFLVYTASSGTALTLDTGVGTGDSILEDFTLLTFVSAATTTGLSVGPTNGCNSCKINRVIVQNFQTNVTTAAFNPQFSSVTFGPCSTAASTVAFVQNGVGDDTYIYNSFFQSCATLMSNNGSNGPIWVTNTSFSNATTVFINANAANVICSNCHLFNQAAGSATNWFTASSSLYFSNTFFEDAKSSGTQASCGSMTSGTLNLSNVTITNEGGETCTLFVALSSTAALSGNGITNTNTTLVPTLYTANWPKATVFGYHTSTLDNAVTVLNPLILNAAPTIAANGCGGSAAAINNNPNGPASFAFSVGSTPGSACTVTLPTAANGWSCTAVDVTTQSTSVFLQKAVPTGLSGVTITNYNTAGSATAFVASDFVTVNCFAR